MEHNSRQRQAKFSVLFKVHFFQTCRGQFTSYKRLHFFDSFFSCNITIKPIVMTLNWILLDEFVLLVNTVK